MTPAPLACRLLALSMVTLSTGCGRAAPPLVVNESASLPRGVYRLTDDRPARGAIVAFRPSAEGRRYLSRLGAGPDARLLKRVVATEGDVACRTEDHVSWPGGRARALEKDRHGRDLPRWQGCRRLADGDVLVLGDTPLSFDSRYLGPVRKADLIGSYKEAWTW